MESRENIEIFDYTRIIMRSSYFSSNKIIFETDQKLMCMLIPFFLEMRQQIREHITGNCK
jgi:hypothetical protein